MDLLLASLQPAPLRVGFLKTDLVLPIVGYDAYACVRARAGGLRGSLAKLSAARCRLAHGQGCLPSVPQPNALRWREPCTRARCRTHGRVGAPQICVGLEGARRLRSRRSDLDVVLRASIKGPAQPATRAPGTSAQPPSRVPPHTVFHAPALKLTIVQQRAPVKAVSAPRVTVTRHSGTACVCEPTGAVATRSSSRSRVAACGYISLHSSAVLEAARVPTASHLGPGITGATKYQNNVSDPLGCSSLRRPATPASRAPSQRGWRACASRAASCWGARRRTVGAMHS